LAQTLWLTKSYELMSYLRLMIRCHMNRLSKHPHALSDLVFKERLLPWSGLRILRVAAVLSTDFDDYFLKIFILFQSFRLARSPKRTRILALHTLMSTAFCKKVFLLSTVP